MKHYALAPQDAWFFRDGRPYNHGESDQADVSSQFPPSARTLTGAIRAALARANGWKEGCENWPRWPANLTTAFGASVADLGKLQFSGPYLLHQKQALWPMPRHILGKQDGDKWAPKAFLTPGKTEVITDRGSVFLPQIALPAEQRDGLKPAESAWITKYGISALLWGGLPAAESIFFPSKLWKMEPRVGQKRNTETLQVDEGDLYSPSLVRLTKETALGISFDGLLESMNSLGEWFPLGGESRLAQCGTSNIAPLPDAPKLSDFKANTSGHVEFTITLVTPGVFPDPAAVLPGVSVISACVAKPHMIGGWDSLKTAPLPLTPHHPAGSTWFCRASATDFANIHARHGYWLGEKKHTAHGFGQIVVGQWPRTQI